MRPVRTSSRRTAFTLVEGMVVVGIIALLIAILIPTLGAFRNQGRSAACGSNLKQQGVALRLFMNDSDERLPQLWFDPSDCDSVYAPPRRSPLQANDPGSLLNVGSHYGGKIGDLGFYCINEIGAARRPLNAYLGMGAIPPDDTQDGLASEDEFQTPIFEDPADIGGDLSAQGIGRVESMYELVGNSYVINDHALSEEPDLSAPESPTLVPKLCETGGEWTQARDGRMPDLSDPAKTWLLGDAPIYNFDKADNRRHAWHGSRDDIRANLLFADLHVGLGLSVKNPGDIESADMTERLRLLNRTDDYTFLPQQNWLETGQEGADPCPTP